MVRYTLKQCSYFLAVAEAGGIAQAARSLNLSQPAVAQAIDKLEQTSGLRLFDRHHARGLELTAQGRAFSRSVEQLLAQARKVERDAAAIAANLSGSLRVGCFHTIAPFFLARLMVAHRSLYPDVEIIASELRQDELVTGLTAGDLDLVLTYDMALERTNLRWQSLARLVPVILLPATHPLAARRSISLRELADEPLVMFDGPGSRDYFRSILAAQGIAPPIAFNSSSMESVRCAVGSGLGFSLSVMVPRHDRTYDGGRLVSVAIAERIEPISIVLARKKGARPGGLIDSFEDFCRSHFEAIFERS